MTKAGMIRAVFPRRPQNGWKLKRVTVEKARTGRYYAYVLYESLVQPPEPVLPAPERTLGLKYSLRHFYVDDQGNRADPPRWLKQSQEKLVHLQRRLNRMQPGSKNYEEAVLKYRLLHEHIANQRRDFLHKESRRISQRLGCRMCEGRRSGCDDGHADSGRERRKGGGVRDVPGDAVLQAGPPGKSIYSGRPVSPYHPELFGLWVDAGRAPCAGLQAKWLGLSRVRRGS